MISVCENLVTTWYDYAVSASFSSGSSMIFVMPVFIGISVITGLIWVFENAPNKRGKLFLDSGVGLLIVTLVVSRITFILEQWSYYQSHLIEIPQLHLGGYSWVGGILGWGIGITVVSRIIHMPLLDMLDYFLPLGTCLIIGVWLGDWFEGLAYGVQSDQWWALPAVNEWGVMDNRFPVQMIGALFALVLMLAIDRITMKNAWKHWVKAPGLVGALYLSGFSFSLLLLSFFRADPSPLWYGQRLDMWLSSGFLFAGILIFSICLVTRIKATDNTGSR